MLAGFGPQLLAGAAVTLELAFGALILGLALGLAGAAAKLSPRRWISRPVTLLLNLLRGVPEFLILLIVYFGAAGLVGDDLAPGPFGAGVFALGLVFGAYASETFRGGFLSVPHGQIEAARACGMSRSLVYRRVVLPIALRQALPSYGNEIILMIKGTSLTSIITLLEITGIAQQIISQTYRAVEVFACAGAIYLAMNYLVAHLVAILEHRLSHHLRAPDVDTAMAIEGGLH